MKVFHKYLINYWILNRASFEDIEDNFTTPLSPRIDTATGKISIDTNLNAASSRIFNPVNYLKAYCKIRFKTKS